MLIKSTQKTTHFCLESTTALLAKSEDLGLCGRKGARLHVPAVAPSAEEHHRPRQFEGTSHSREPLALQVVEARPSPVPISERFADNKAECILQGWTFSPRLSHYQILIMLISQPLESRPAFHRQRGEERMIVAGAAPYLAKCSPSVPSCNSLHVHPGSWPQLSQIPSTGPTDFSRPSQA